MTDDKQQRLNAEALKLTCSELAQRFARYVLGDHITFTPIERILLQDALDSYARRPSSATSVDIERVKAWFYSKPRKQAQAAFTAGDERQIAYMLEDAEAKVLLANQAKAVVAMNAAAQSATAHAGELTFSAFRRANAARCLKWHPEGIASWSPSDWLTAVTGELGELASLLKMRNRERDGLPGNKFSPTDKQIADEIADVLTYLDLLAEVLGVDLGRAAAEKFNEVSERVGFPDRIDLSARTEEVPSKGPHRACRLTLLLEADSKEDMMRGLDSFGQALARDELTKGTWGSPSHGAIYEYQQGDSPTHDEYFEQTRAYLETLRSSGPKERDKP